MKKEPEMTRNKAIKIDKSFYADLDEGSNLYCVFGSESGFAYSSFMDKNVAEEWAKNFNKHLSSFDEVYDINIFIALMKFMM